MNAVAFQRMDAGRFKQWLILLLGAVGCVTASGQSQSSAAQIRLEPQAASQIQMDGISEREQKMLASMPANFHFFGVAGNDRVRRIDAGTGK
jgi:hypothetical protein